MKRDRPPFTLCLPFIPWSGYGVSAELEELFDSALTLLWASSNPAGPQDLINGSFITQTECSRGD